MGLRDALFGPSIGPEAAADRLRTRGATVLDVRERHEYDAGRIRGARHLPPHRLDAAALKPDVLYITVCRSGARSASASRQLRRAGLEVLNLRGGMLAWQRAGLPMDPRNGRVR